jgi:potassium-transporting ATPase ATP-binding subunit
MMEKGSPLLYPAETLLVSVYRGFAKLNPFKLYRNPVIFITEIGAFLTAVQFFFAEPNTGFFSMHVSILLWITVIFANIAEAFAETRSEAKTGLLRKARSATLANLYDQDGNLNVVTYKDLKKGDLILIRKDEIIAVDGEIISGYAAIDESAVTGEAQPIIRRALSQTRYVNAGTKVISDEIVVKVTANPGEGFIDKMIEFVESAERKKTHNELALTILLANMCVIFLVVVVTFQIFGIYFEVQLDITMQIALLTVLIPTTIGGLLNAITIAGINRLMRKNVIAKSGQAIEAAGDVDFILLDKTGTITYGNRLAIELTPAFTVPEEEFARGCYLSTFGDETKEGLTILELVKRRFPFACVRPNTKYDFLPFSVQARLSGIDMGEEKYRKGALDAIEQFLEKTAPPDIQEHVQMIAQKGNTPLVVADERRILGVITLEDKIKPGLSTQFQEFKLLGVKTAIITGDNPLTASVIAREVHADDFLASASPEQKLHYLKQQQLEGHTIAMTGDGVNDVPALAQADLGIAMNEGAQAAKEAANMIDLDSQPNKLFEIIEIGKRLLLTRGALTALSIGNDISKYFVLLPALLIPFFPEFEKLNFLNLSSPQNTILSAVIFNTISLIVLIPLAFNGVKLIPNKVDLLFKKHVLVYGMGGVILPLIGIKLIDLLISRWTTLS